LAAPAALGELRALGATPMMSRFVIVQRSFYGTDNSVMLESLDELGDNGRGVAVINPSIVTADVLANYSARGVRGLRLNLYSRLGDVAPLTQRLAPVADCARAAGWHVQVIAAIEILIENAELLLRAGVPIVIDHYDLYGRRLPTALRDTASSSFLPNPRFGPSSRHRTAIQTIPSRRSRTSPGWKRSSPSLKTAACGAATGRIRRRTARTRVRTRRGPTAHCPIRRLSTASSTQSGRRNAWIASCGTTRAVSMISRP
jgi:hypothetical protein